MINRFKALQIREKKKVHIIDIAIEKNPRLAVKLFGENDLRTKKLLDTAADSFFSKSMRMIRNFFL